MSKETKIQWTDATWNPWTGCKKVSPGCKFCYMYRDKEHYGNDPKAVLKSKTKFKEPLKWKEPKRVFTCSWSDFFIDEADVWRNEAWDIIRKTPHLTYQILTKRPERILDNLPSDFSEFKNVQIGVSIETQNQIGRLEYLKKLNCTTFASLEPLIGKVVLPENSGLDWVIIGGESGNNVGKYQFRPCEMEWIESLVNQCKEMDIPVFVKQLGTFLAKENKLSDRHGGDINEFPNNLQIRQFPK